MKKQSLTFRLDLSLPGIRNSL